jgi:ubiquinone/menaquinone biosynthesis C-methylase UbiE
MDYRQSHTAPDFGLAYDVSFRNLPYRKMVWGWERDVLKNIITELGQEKAKIKYLDFACGTGRILGLLEQYVDESCGVDVSGSMLDVAEKNVKNSKLICCDLTREKRFADDTFDVITAFRFFLNAQQDLREDALQVINRIMKKDGYLVFNIHMNKGCILEKVIRAYRRIKNIDAGGEWSLSTTEVKGLLEKSDFEITEMYHFGIFPIYSEDHKFLINLLNRVERYLSRIPLFLSLSRYIIYVCQKRIGEQL